MVKTPEKPKKMVSLANVLIIGGIWLAFLAAIPQGAIKHYLFNLSAPTPDYPVIVGYLNPDIEVPFLFSDYLAKRDAALKAILEIESLN